MLLLATVLYGVAVRGNAPGTALTVIVATAAVGDVIFRRRPGETASEAVMQKAFLAAILLFAALAALGWAPSGVGQNSRLLDLVSGVAWSGLALTLYATSRVELSRLTARLIVALTLLITLLVGLTHLNAVEGIGNDVNLLHAAAARAMENGENPYSDAVVVPDGSPLTEPGATIIGYPYPPVTAFAYAVGEWTLSDPRYTSLASWLILLGLMGLSGIRRARPSMLFVMLLIAALPGWPMILRGGWTEPFSLLLVGVAVLSWRKATGSGVALGSALASKQFFLVTAPLVLLHRDDGWIRRLVASVAVVALTIGGAFLIDAGAFWSAAIEFHASTPTRFDSNNLVGLLSSLGVVWAPPASIALVVGLLVAAAAGWRSRNRVSFTLGMGLTLAVSFLVSPQAFANYWFLVTGLTALGLMTTLVDGTADRGELAT